MLVCKHNVIAEMAAARTWETRLLREANKWLFSQAESIQLRRLLAMTDSVTMIDLKIPALD